MSKTLQTVLSALLCAVLLFSAAVPALAAEEPDPAPGKVTAVTMEDVTLYQTWPRNKTVTLKPTITTDEGVMYTLTYTSSNPTVATVVATADGAGLVTARHKGTVTVTCTVTDEAGNVVSGSCTVTVKYNLWYWLLRILIPVYPPIFPAI